MKWALMYLLVGIMSMWALRGHIWEFCDETQKPADPISPEALFYCIAIVVVLLWPLAVYCRGSDMMR